MSKTGESNNPLPTEASSESALLGKDVSSDKPLSKRALKELQKKQLHAQNYAAYKAFLKEKDKRRKKERQKRRLELGEVTSPVRRKPQDVRPSSVSVVVDCAFDNLMTDTEIKHLANQLKRIYSANRQSLRPVGLYFTSFGGALKAYMDDKVKDHSRWKDVHFRFEPFDDLFPRDRTVYLTADTETKLNVIADDAVCVIGGLVDKNRHKNICLRKAQDLELSTKRLPISDHVKMAQRQVLTVNHVGEAIIKYAETGDWALALKEVIPQRRLNVKSKKQRRLEQRSAAIGTSVPAVVAESVANIGAGDSSQAANNTTSSWHLHPSLDEILESDTTIFRSEQAPH